MKQDGKELVLYVLILIGIALIFFTVHFWTGRLEERVEELERELIRLEEELEEIWEGNRELERQIEESTVYRGGSWEIEVIKDIQDEVLYWHYGEPTEKRAKLKAWEIYLCGTEHDIDPLLITSMAIVESRLTHNVKPSSAGATGIMQIMPATAKFLEIDAYDRFENIWGGTKFFAELVEMYEGDMEKALSHYNSGRSDQAYPETRHYVQKVLTTYESLRE